MKMTSRSPIRTHYAARSRTDRGSRAQAKYDYPEEVDYGNEPRSYNNKNNNNSGNPLEFLQSDEFKSSVAISSNETLGLTDSRCASGVEVAAQDSEQRYNPRGVVQEASAEHQVKQRGGGGNGAAAKVKLQDVAGCYPAYKVHHQNKRLYSETTYDEPTSPSRPNYHRRATPHEYSEKQRGYNEPITSDPLQHTSIAPHKLQRLKELQWRRNLTEKYYSQEINRLIGEKYAAFETRIPSGSTRHEKNFPSSYIDDLINPALSNLEQCGTMVTITRLDCGCVEQTTRPIFTTLSGQTQKRNCALQQEQQVSMNLSAPSGRLVMPVNHPPPAAGRNCSTNNSGAKLRSKSFAEQPRRTNEPMMHQRSSQPNRQPSASSIASA